VLRTQNQISRAQCRVKIGTPNAKNAGAAEAGRSRSPAAGKVQAAVDTGEKETRFCVWTWIVAAVAGTGVDAVAGVTQHFALPQGQQAQAGPAARVCVPSGPATACIQINPRQDRMANSRFTVSP
jgi:hypothetical protein